MPLSFVFLESTLCLGRGLERSENDQEGSEFLPTALWRGSEVLRRQGKATSAVRRGVLRIGVSVSDGFRGAQRIDHRDGRHPCRHAICPVLRVVHKKWPPLEE